ncbi:MAG: hypothetical protein K2H64_03925 [Desulfovibrio sp.]|nr:hypothetical protein [Desulfovibrio sp.]
MEDQLGLYYLAKPGRADVRVYVREGAGGEIEFRLWHREYPEVWETHGWLPISAIRKAAELYKRERDPEKDYSRLYDESIARSLLRRKK